MPHLEAQSGIQWHYDIEGEGDHLLFIHGWGVDKRIWRQQSKFFSQYYKVMTVDLPGHGKSSWEKVELDVMVTDLKFLLESRQFNDMAIVGSSLGGLVALKLYEIFPECIARMIFVGSMPKFSKSEDYPHGLDVEKMRKLGSQLQSDYPSVVNVFFRSLFTRQERQTRRFKWLQKFRQTDDVPMRQALSDYLDILEKEDLREVLKKVRVPVQFINGREDEICNKETVAFLKELSPGSRFDFFEQCGHFPFLSKPHEFNQVMADFLGGATL
ncbi:MAG: alpha/beta fold hydrolase [Candidatus Omnitrophica bacterium]|nr:alpha/beta fold hydrolase [Candidatus Omnitrophota bacterium]